MITKVSPQDRISSVFKKLEQQISQQTKYTSKALLNYCNRLEIVRNSDNIKDKELLALEKKWNDKSQKLETLQWIYKFLNLNKSETGNFQNIPWIDIELKRKAILAKEEELMVSFAIFSKYRGKIFGRQKIDVSQQKSILAVFKELEENINQLSAKTRKAWDKYREILEVCIVNNDMENNKLILTRYHYHAYDKELNTLNIIYGLLNGNLNKLGYFENLVEIDKELMKETIIFSRTFKYHESTITRKYRNMLFNNNN